MAKKRINPEVFRAGIVKNWPHQVKLLNYGNTVPVINHFVVNFSDYWFNKVFCKLVYSKKKWVFTGLQNKRLRLRFARKLRRLHRQRSRRQMKLQSVFSFFKKTVAVRRRQISLRIFLMRRRYKIARRRRWKAFCKQLPRFWYKRRKRRKLKFSRRAQKLRKKWIKKYAKKNNYNRSERAQIFFRNYYNLNALHAQDRHVHFLRFLWQDGGLSVGGSTALRRYQFNIRALQPPRWTTYIYLKSFSFKKMVGFVLSKSQRRHQGYFYLLLLSQINIALHWHNSQMFAQLFRQLLERQYRVQGSLRLMHELLNRLQLTRYNITCIKLMVTGSFGKLSRSKSLRLGRLNANVQHSLTQITQSVSYADSQIWTVRGVLGLRVWIFW